VGGLVVVGPVTPDVTGSVVTGSGCGDVAAPYQQPYQLSLATGDAY